ncbi:MAG TPA: prolyl oligopeptidase family serine peptidase, partial [Ktedonobacteraceae bacterium]|nr:prolyl oligopeptidase family serine peptidase [Ktedonobacteraceae bacterium]
PDLTSVDVSFQGSGGLTLHGTIVEPVHAPTDRPGIVLVSGSGSGLRTGLLSEAIAFAQQGLSILIYDKRSVGYSFFQRNYSQLADDALAAVRTLRTHRGVDSQKVGIWGLSEGGWVAPLAASRSSDIAFVIVVGANAMEPLRQETWAVDDSLHRAGVGGALLTRTEPTMFRFIAAVGVFPEAYYNATAVLSHIGQPLLGIWGSNDRSTAPGENPPLFARALQQGGNSHYTFRFFKNASHPIHVSLDGGVTSLPNLAPGYAQLIGSWVHAVTSGHLPNDDAPTPPQQDWLSVPVSPLPWWESLLQLIVVALLIVAFAAYPLVALVRRLRGSSQQIVGSIPARLLAGVGAGTVLGLFVYLISLLMSTQMRAAPGPLLAGRPLAWLLLQAASLVVVGLEVWTAVIWRRAGSSVNGSERLRLGLLLLGGALFMLWALYWGLFLP